MSVLLFTLPGKFLETRYFNSRSAVHVDLLLKPCPYGTNKVSHPLVSKDTKYKAAFTNFLLPKCVLDLV